MTCIFVAMDSPSQSRKQPRRGAFRGSESRVPQKQEQGRAAGTQDHGQARPGTQPPAHRAHPGQAQLWPPHSHSNADDTSQSPGQEAEGPGWGSWQPWALSPGAQDGVGKPFSRPRFKGPQETLSGWSNCHPLPSPDSPQPLPGLSCWTSVPALQARVAESGPRAALLQELPRLCSGTQVPGSPVVPMPPRPAPRQRHHAAAANGSRLTP